MCLKINMEHNTSPEGSLEDRHIGEEDEKLDVMRNVLDYWKDAPPRGRIHIIVQYLEDLGEFRPFLQV
jgi:hypothetical protein